MNNTQRKRKRAKGRMEAVLLLLSVTAVAAALIWEPPEMETVAHEQPMMAQETTSIPSNIVTIAQTAVQETAEPEETETPKKTYIGQFTVTAYCSCEICCGEWANNRPNGIVYTASGAEAKDGVTVGAAWDVLPVGTVIEIEGLGQRIVQDKPADWIVERYNGKIIDAYFGSHEAALEYGKHTVDVWIIEDPEGGTE